MNTIKSLGKFKDYTNMYEWLETQLWILKHGRNSKNVCIIHAFNKMSFGLLIPPYSGVNISWKKSIFLSYIFFNFFFHTCGTSGLTKSPWWNTKHPEKLFAHLLEQNLERHCGSWNSSEISWSKTIVPLHTNTSHFTFLLLCSVQGQAVSWMFTTERGRCLTLLIAASLPP